MKHFNKFKNHIRQEQSELPDGLSWEEMQDGIFSKMEENQTPPQSPKRYFNKFFFMGIGFLVGIVFISFLFLQKEQKLTGELSSKINWNNDNQSQSKNNIIENKSIGLEEIDIQKREVERTIKSKPNNTIQSIGNINSTSENNIIQNAKKADDSSTKDKTQNEHVSNDLPVHDPKSSDSKGNTPIESVSKPEFQQEISSRVVDKKDEFNTVDKNKFIQENTTRSTLPNTLEDNVKDNNQSYSGSDKSTASMTSQLLTIIDYLPTTNWNFLKSTSTKALGSPEVETKPGTSPIIKPTHKILWSLEIGGGWNTWSFGLSRPNEVQSLYANINADYGFSFTSRLGRKINKRFGLTTGLDLDIMYKKLNLSYTELSNRELKNAIVGHKENVISGETEYIYADTTVVDTTIFTVTNFNRYQMVSIPLIVNYNILKNSNWSLDIGLGPSITFLTSYRGKYFEDNELKSFDKSSNLYSTSPKIAFSASLQLRKKFVNDFYLGFRMDLKSHLSNWALDTENGLKPKVVSGMIVIGKEF